MDSRLFRNIGKIEFCHSVILLCLEQQTKIYHQNTFYILGEGEGLRYYKVFGEYDWGYDLSFTLTRVFFPPRVCSVL